MVTNAMLLMGAIASGETPTPAELSDGLSRMNELIDNWSLQDLTALVNERHVFPVVAGQQVYTLGPAGSDFIVANRPSQLTNVGLLLNTASPSVEIPCALLTDDQWAIMGIKELSITLFTAVYYNQTSPAGTITLWPIPNTAQNDLVIYYDSILAQFANLTQSYTLPAGYAKALRYNLAVELSPEFGRQISEVVMMTAAASLRQLKAANVKMSDLEIDPALSHSSANNYNVLTDGWNGRS